MKIKQGMILAAGLGKRMQPLTLKTPKPLLEINNYTLLERAINLLISHGVQEISINVHYLPDQIKSFINRKKFKVKITISNEENLLLQEVSALNPEEQIQYALDQMMKKNYNDSKDILDHFILNFPENQLSGSAHFWLGKIYLFETNYRKAAIVFGEGATYTGNVGLETDGDLHYNPSTGTVTATIFKGNIDAVDGDFDGTLEADAITLNGTAVTATATLSTGISNTNVAQFGSGVVDDDFLRVNGTTIEGRSASEVLSDIGATTAALAADEATALAIALG